MWKCVSWPKFSTPLYIIYTQYENLQRPFRIIIINSFASDITEEIRHSSEMIRDTQLTRLTAARINRATCKKKRGKTKRSKGINRVLKRRSVLLFQKWIVYFYTLRRNLCVTFWTHRNTRSCLIRIIVKTVAFSLEKSVTHPTVTIKEFIYIKKIDIETGEHP